MKAVISSLFLLLTMFLVKAQDTEENRFQQSENAATGSGSAIGGVGGEQIEEGPGNPPGDEDSMPIPIDNNLPLLVVMGASIAVYHFRKKMMIKTK